MWVQSQGQEGALEECMATHSYILAWKVPWTEEPGGLQSIGSHRVRHNWSDLAHTQATRAQKNILDSFLPHFWIFLGLLFWFFFSLLIFKHWSAHGFNPSPLCSLPTVTPLVISFSMMTLVAMITWWFPDLYSQSWHLCLTPKLGDLIGISNLVHPSSIYHLLALSSLFLIFLIPVNGFILYPFVKTEKNLFWISFFFILYIQLPVSLNHISLRHNLLFPRPLTQFPRWSPWFDVFAVPSP